MPLSNIENEIQMKIKLNDYKRQTMYFCVYIAELDKKHYIHYETVMENLKHDPSMEFNILFYERQVQTLSMNNTSEAFSYYLSCYGECGLSLNTIVEFFNVIENKDIPTWGYNGATMKVTNHCKFYISDKSSLKPKLQEKIIDMKCNPQNYKKSMTYDPVIQSCWELDPESVSVWFE